MGAFRNFKIEVNQVFLKSDTNNLTRNSVKGGAYTLASTLISFIVNILRTLVLARLLAPSDFGLIGMVTVIVGFIAMFKDAGLSTATIQKDTITNQQISNLAWYNMLVSTGLGLLIVLISPLIAAFYSKPELTLVSMALAVSFIAEGLFIQHKALLQRSLRFDTLTLISVSSNTTGVVVAIVSAMFGLKYWSLVMGQVAATITDCMLTFAFCKWIPLAYDKKIRVDGMFKFGLNIVLSNLVNYFARNADSFIIGKFCGAHQLGIYSKSYQLFRLPTNNILSPIRNVALPALSSIQTNELQFVKYYKSIIALTATLIFPISIYFYFEADFLIPFILGNQWVAAVPIFQLLALGGIVQPITGQSGIVMVATGNSKRYLNWQLIYSFTLVVSFFIGIQYGVRGLAMAYVIAEFLLFVPGLFYTYKNTFIKPKYVVAQLIYPLLSSLLVVVFVFGIIDANVSQKNLPFHFLIAVLFFGCYSLVVWLKRDMREMIKTMFKLLINK